MEVKIIIIVLVGAFFTVANATGNEKLIVEKVLQESTQRYDERLKLAMTNGAQSPQREPRKSTKRTREIGRISHIYRNAYKTLILEHKMNASSATSHLREMLPSQCEIALPDCNPDYVYRTNTGVCNNLRNPLWGSTERPNNRIIRPSYEGEFDDPRGGIDTAASTLPNPRKITLMVHSSEEDSFDRDVSHMVAQFGQFLDHDISLTPVEPLGCCANPDASDDCWKITVDSNDPFYGAYGKTCLDFVRSTPACFPSGGTNTREQMNIITAYIDGSVVYGSDGDLVMRLRSRVGGKLKENSDYPGFLPWTTDVGLPEEGGRKAIKAGDVRADEMPGLTTLHSLFLREHNRIASEFAKLMPNWDDETLFQETRRILAAELQKITYDEFLPAIFGAKGMVTYDLRLPPVLDDFTTYDDSVDATIFNSFSTAAYRFGHTLVNGLIQLYLGDKAIDEYNVRENYGNVTKVMVNHSSGKTGYHLILNGLIRQKAQAFDTSIHKDMTNHLFNDLATNIGHDLAARNIQRGRDHGLPSYNEFRKFCRLEPLTTWVLRPKEISATTWTKLWAVYQPNPPTDIDLYTGGLAEIADEGTLAGPTFLCLQAHQFQRMMKGDRFFFTHENQTGSFTKEQLALLRKRTFGDIICQNSDLEETPRNVFYVSNANSNTNPMIACDDKSRLMDLSVFTVGGGDDNTSTTTEGASALSAVSFLVMIIFTTFVTNFVQ